MNPDLQQAFVRKLRLLDVPVTRLVTDSRHVGKGDTFVAYPGEKSDGRQFIAQAIAQGANAVIYEKSRTGNAQDKQDFIWKTNWHVPNLAVTELRQKAGWLADAVHVAPSEHLWTVGVTGTNGKTSTSHWIAKAFNDARRKCALIGTLGNGFADELQPTINTTPDAIQLHGLLADYLHHGARAVAMEVSSHALAQGRVTGVRFDVALLTNLSRDHLDYHGDMQQYADAKRQLFEWQSLKYAVVNLDDEFGSELALQLKDGQVEVVAYGLSDRALTLAGQYGLRMVHGKLLEMSAQGMRLEVHSSWGGAVMTSVLVGRFNAANLLGALAVLLVSDVEMGDAVQSLSEVQPVAGRMQQVGAQGQPAVIVDYAHTPDALEKVLLALREACLDADKEMGGKLICVFGCGGDRDKGKRGMMGRVAEMFSDHCIVTSDNPRSEAPQNIIDDVLADMEAGNHEVILDRAAAIKHAIALAQAGDTVLLAGKGHEEYQEINGIRQPFSDVQVARRELEKWSEPVAQTGGVR